MGTTISSSTDESLQNSVNSKNPDLVVRDHTFDYDYSGIEYLNAHEIPQLFQDITARLLTERPLDCLRFIRNILIHKVIQEQDHKHRINPSSISTNHSSSSLSPPRPNSHTDHTKSAKLSPVNINIGDYDADKLLESRTTTTKKARTRSYSDSAIMFNDDINLRDPLHKSCSNTNFTFNDIKINVNALSQPYDNNNNNVPPKYACSVSPRNVLHKNNLNIDVISSVMDNMQIDANHKNAFMQILQHKSVKSDKCDKSDNSEKMREEKTMLNAENKSDDKSDDKAKLFSMSNKFNFQTKLRSLSHITKSIPSKLKHQLNDMKSGKSLSLYSKSESFHANENETEKSSKNMESKSKNESKLQNIDQELQPLRRSWTMDELLPSAHSHSQSHRHILSLSQRPCFGFDIGGSLTKISFFEPHKTQSRWNMHDRVKTEFVTSSTKYGSSGIRDMDLSFPWRNGTFHFIHFQTHRMAEAVNLWRTENLLQKNETFYATGGGAHKYSQYFHEKLSVRVKKGDELKCLISGLNFLLNHVSDECYYLSEPASKQPSPKISLDIKKEGSVFPYVLVNIGSGVSILRVDSPTQFERVSGSQIGGGTYWGLCRLCSYSCNKNEQELTFQKAFELAMKGDATKVNMLVSDIYGGDYPQFNLPGDLVASAFGKCISIKNPSQELAMGDIARGLLDVIAMNCAQLAYLNAMRFKITRILFAGNFLRQNDLSMAMISYAIHYWSQGVIKACFLKHEGYFGSIGVMLLPDNELQDD